MSVLQHRLATETARKWTDFEPVVNEWANLPFSVQAGFLQMARVERRAHVILPDLSALATAWPHLPATIRAVISAGVMAYREVLKQTEARNAGQTATADV